MEVLIVLSGNYGRFDLVLKSRVFNPLQVKITAFYPNYVIIYN